MQSAIFRNSQPELKEQWILLESNLISNNFQKILIGRTIKYSFQQEINGIKFIITIKPIYFNDIEIDVSFSVNLQIIYHKKELGVLNGIFLIHDSSIYYISDNSFDELCKNFPMIKEKFILPLRESFENIEQ